MEWNNSIFLPWNRPDCLYNSTSGFKSFEFTVTFYYISYIILHLLYSIVSLISLLFYLHRSYSHPILAVGFLMLQNGRILILWYHVELFLWSRASMWVRMPTSFHPGLCLFWNRNQMVWMSTGQGFFVVITEIAKRVIFYITQPRLSRSNLDTTDIGFYICIWYVFCRF